MPGRKPNPTTEIVEFAGESFKRYPHSPRLELRRYHLARGGRRLHRAIWEAANGPVPVGCHIHHRDGNTLNNAIENLECVTISAHMQEHWRMATPERRQHLHEQAERAREFAKSWHGSAEGLAWHKEHGGDCRKHFQPSVRGCELCGKDFTDNSIQKSGRFCSNKCKSAWRRQAGLDDVLRACVECSKLFRVNRYQRTCTCSGDCAKKRTAASRCSRVRPDSCRSSGVLR